MHPTPTPLDPAVRLMLEGVYRILLSAVVELARTLGKPCPVATRAERRASSEEGRYLHE